MACCDTDPRMMSYHHIACYDEDKLIGYADTVSYTGLDGGTGIPEAVNAFKKMMKAPERVR